MKTTNPLVEVDFVDNTLSALSIDAADVVGMVVNTDWGQPDKLVRLDRTAWASFADPTGQAKPNYSMACVERAFECGASTVEVIRAFPSATGQQYVGFTIAPATASGDRVLSIATGIYNEGEEGETSIKLRLRYPGNPNITIALAPYLKGFDKLPAPLTNKKVANLQVFVGTAINPAEQFLVTLEDEDVYVDGMPYFIREVVNTQSAYLWCSDDQVAAKWTISDATPQNYGAAQSKWNESLFTNGSQDLEGWKKAANAFLDRDQSVSTILVNTYGWDNPEEATQIGGILATAANTRMDCVALLGCSKSLFNTPDLDAVQKAIIDYFVALSSSDKFVNYLAAYERYRYKNKTFYMDGTATLAGRMCYVSNQFNRNTLPSYKATGLVNSVLVKSLDFNRVVSMMEEYGIGSIYSTAQGNYLFNIRTAYPIQSSYFGKLNVARVTAKVLRWLLSDVETAIHTDTVSDVLKLLSFEKTENLKLQQMISVGELKAESIIIANPTNNSDLQTSGGECLNVDCELWFKKLVERVRIKIIATDNVTQVEVS